MISHEDLQTHLYGVVRDGADNPMSICERLEFCVMNECVAIFEGRWLDFHYFARGASFHVYKGRRLIRTVGAHINFSKQTRLEGRIDRFEVSSYDFCHLLQAIYQASGNQLDEWRCSSIDCGYESWLARRDPFSPPLLAFLISDEGHLPVYPTPILTPNP